jgi:hypothetical protein
MTESVQMVNLGVEEAREMLGLLIIVAWMAVLTIESLRRTRKEL